MDDQLPITAWLAGNGFQQGEMLKTGFLGVTAVMMMLLTATNAEARTKRSQSAKVAF